VGDPFIHLHVHSEYSILDGAVKLDAMLDEAVARKMPAVALTDHGNIFGAVELFKKAKKRDIKPILGCEAYVAPRSRLDKGSVDSEVHHFHLILLVKNEEGYRNMCRLITRSYIEGFYYRPRIDKELLAAHSKGLIGLSSCLKGEVNYLVGKGLEADAERVAGEYADIFAKGDYYLELQDHGIPLQKTVNAGLVRLAVRTGLPLVATNDVHYLRREDAESHDVLLCIQTNKKVTDQDRIRFHSDAFYFKSGAEMEALFGEIPGALHNTFHIAAQCDFRFPSGGHFLPHFKPPAGEALSDYFARVVREGFAVRVPGVEERRRRGEAGHALEEYEERLEREIKLIQSMKFEGYFLVVWDLIRAARERGIPVGPGRGSAAGSIVAWSLGITEIDPIEFDLLFERFLNPERISLPDIDIDFCGRRRGEVLSYVTDKYGQENVCQIITFGTMAARGAVRDVGRALEVPLPEVDRIAKMIPFGPDSTIADAVKTIPALRELKTGNAKIAQLLAVASQLEGQVRHPSIHAAGVVITPKPLVEYMPLYQSAKGEITTQFPMGDIESIGLLKMDLLGLRNLTVIRDTLELVARETGERVDIDAVPPDDPATFRLFQAGNTDGVFQFESHGMKDLLRSYGPETFRDLIAMNALYRPGPLKSGMTDQFIKRKRHPEQATVEFPEFEPVLKETRGIIVYQEQVMKIATELAGFSLAEADLLRKAMGKKVAEIMEEQKLRFLQGAQKKGLTKARAAKIFEQIRFFAEYGFNKSHSAAYAYLAYQTAYLKAHYPVHFLAALLTSEAERGATAQLWKYINECQAMGIKVLPPDINESGLSFTVSQGAIRFGLGAIKNVGENAVLAVLRARERKGRFRTPFEIFDEAEPQAINRKVVESLIKAGAFDALGWKRSQLFHLLDEIVDYAHGLQKIQSASQSLLFGAAEMNGGPQIPEEVLGMSEWDEPHFLSYEKDVLGFYITGHPLTQYEKRLKRVTSHGLGDLDDERDAGSEVRVAGIIASVKPTKTKKDERMAVLSLEDLTGRLDVVVFPEAYKKSMELLREGALVWVKGRFQVDGENRKIVLAQIQLLEDALLKQAKRFVLKVFLPGLEESLVRELRDLLNAHPGGCPVFFELEIPHAYKVITRSVEVQSVAPTDELVRRVEGLLGENSVAIDYA
jgi:DNA polymerase-3 subunit alpha